MDVWIFGPLREGFVLHFLFPGFGGFRRIEVALMQRANENHWSRC